MNINTEIIVKLDSKNASVDCEKTKVRFNDVWMDRINEEKQKAVRIGGYKDTKAFSVSRHTGNISVRMAVALGVAFNINPFWICGEDVEEKGSEEKINEFLLAKGFEKYCSNNLDEVKDGIASVMVEVVKNIPDGIGKKLEELSDEDYVKIFEALLIKNKIYKNKTVDAIKFLIIS